MPEYIEAAWWTLARAEEKGMLERGHRVVNWCPRCETAIADAEVEYRDVNDPSVFVKFPLKGKKNEYLVIWTTTPWTLPANVAVAVAEDFEYAKVLAKKDDRETLLWIAEPLVKAVLKKGRCKDFSILETKKGADLAGWEYESPLCFLRATPARDRSQGSHRRFRCAREYRYGTYRTRPWLGRLRARDKGGTCHCLPGGWCREIQRRGRDLCRPVRAGFQ